MGGVRLRLFTKSFEKMAHCVNFQFCRNMFKLDSVFTYCSYGNFSCMYHCIIKFMEISSIRIHFMEISGINFQLPEIKTLSGG